MFEIGRLCLKIAGRDANKTCVVVEVIDERYVLVDGQTRRRKCNVMHLEPLEKVVKLKKGASHADVKKAFVALKIDVRDTKPKTVGEKPKRTPKKKVVEEVSKKDAKKAEKVVKKVEKASEKVESKTVADK